MRVTDKQIIKALESTGGFLTQAAKKLGVSYQAIQNRFKRNPKLKAKQEEMRDRQLDFTESKLLKLIGNENLGAICFYLKCQGKHRGWVERQEVTGKDGENIKIIVTGV